MISNRRELGFAVSIATCLLLSQVFSTGFGGVFSENAPSLSLTLNPGNAAALARMASARKNSNSEAGQIRGSSDNNPNSTSGQPVLGDQATQQPNTPAASADSDKTKIAEPNLPGSSGSAPPVGQGSTPMSRNDDTRNGSGTIAPQNNSDDLPDFKIPPEEMKKLALEALHTEPQSVDAIRSLALYYERTGQAELAAKFAKIAISLSKRDIETHYLMIKNAVNKSQLSDVLNHIEIVYSAFSILRPRLMIPLARLADHPDGQKLIVQRLLSEPNWKDQFIESYPANSSNDEMPMKLYLALKEGGKPPEMAALRPYMLKLLASKTLDKAYYTWLQFLPPEQLKNLPLLFNGTFESQPSGVPFDWLMFQLTEARTEVVRDANSDNHFLQVSFTGDRIFYTHTRQALLLAPGKYRLSGDYKTNEFTNTRGMVWRIVCLAEKNSIQAESERMRERKTDWKKFELHFEIPSSACSAQLLMLALAARNGLESIVSGQVMFDNIAVTRTYTQ